MGKLFGGIREALRGIWPDTSNIELPQRVVEKIAKNDDLSEILVKVIQFTMFTLWGAAYLAAPQPNPETVSQVPFVITFYLIFTLARLYIDLTSRSPVWLIYLSIAVDMALLTYLIWSFHIQYGQPASFSLKVVEVMNFFVLIGLRSLRFEARYVIASGVMAVLCWLFMIAYVTVSDPAGPMITRDYVTYLTSNTILVGAEISKMLSIVMFTIILAIAVRRAHYFLVSSMSEASAAQDLSRFMDKSAAQQIRKSDHQIEAGEGERREIAILNVDIRGFTKLVAPMEPAEAVRLLSDYQHKIVPIVHRHHGVIDKFMGDGIMTTFGATPDDESDYCLNAVRCVEDILTSQKSWTGPVSQLKINLAVTAGPVIYGAVGDGDRLELTVIGPAVNRSAKIEKHNKVLGTRALVGQVCFDIALKQGYVDPGTYKPISTLVGDDTEPTLLMVFA